MLLAQRQCNSETLKYIFDFPGLDVKKYAGKQSILVQKVLEFAFVKHEKALELIERSLQLPRVIFQALPDGYFDGRLRLVNSPVKQKVKFTDEEQSIRRNYLLDLKALHLAST